MSTHQLDTPYGTVDINLSSDTQGTLVAGYHPGPDAIQINGIRYRLRLRVYRSSEGGWFRTYGDDSLIRDDRKGRPSPAAERTLGNVVAYFEDWAKQNPQAVVEAQREYLEQQLERAEENVRMERERLADWESDRNKILRALEAIR